MIKPEKREEMDDRVAKRLADHLKQSYQRVWDEGGYFFWRIEKPIQRLQAYQNVTHPMDKQWVLNKNYLVLLAAGLAPPLQALVLWRKATQPQQLGAGPDGMPITQQPPEIQNYAPYFWGMLLPPSHPEYVFEHYQNDFIALVKAA